MKKTINIIVLIVFLFYSNSQELYASGDSAAIEKYMLAIDNIDIIHKTNDLIEWNNKDYYYLKTINKQKSKELLEKEVVSLTKEMYKAKNNYLLINNIKLYSPYVTLKLNILQKSIDNRVSLLSNSSIDKFEVNENFYNNVSIVTKELCETIKDLSKINYPFFNNVEIYFNNHFSRTDFGLTQKSALHSRNEKIIINCFPQLKSTNYTNTILHELGHVFSNDIFGKKNISDTSFYHFNDFSYEEYKSLVHVNLSIEALEENFAEDMKMYLSKKINKVFQKNTSIPYSSEIEAFITNELNNYHFNTLLAFPNVCVRIDGLITKVDFFDKKTLYSKSKITFLCDDNLSQYYYNHIGILVENNHQFKRYELDDNLNIYLDKKGIYHFYIIYDNCINTNIYKFKFTIDNE